MSLINCKIQLRLKWTKYCALPVTGAGTSTNSDNKMFTIKDTKLYVPVVTLSARNNQKSSNFLVKQLKDQFIELNVK